MVAKLLIMGLTTYGTSGMEQTSVLRIMGQREEDTYEFEAYLTCGEFDVPKEEGHTI